MSDTEFRPIEWQSVSQTDVGMVRKVNEDALLARPDIGLWAVADGMGGHAVGDVAANKIIDALSCVDNKKFLSDIIDTVDDALIDVNQDILNYAMAELDGASMGSTVVSLIVRGRLGVCLWVGDSRLYRLRSKTITQLSRDHSQVEEMLQMGSITPEEAETHPQKNVITRAVGGEDELYVDINVFNVQLGDTYMLCSDGLSNSVAEEDIIYSLGLKDTASAAKDLMNKSLSNAPQDNVTLVVIKGLPGQFTNHTVDSY